ncbi:DMT family transporter [Streptomyces sp. NPDC093252]|uniref:DMT family transporter n=1 Tax=Streptomyces sp. NPDC093252 TaxID=3154980 RepID=UPI003429093F
MNASLLAVVLSLLSAVGYAAAAVAQERLAARSPGTGLLRLLRGGAWWGSVLLNASGALLHVVALRYGPLTVVQPLGALTLVAAVPLGAKLAGRRVSATEWRGTALTLTGLAALLVAATGPAPDDVLSVREALLVSAATAVFIGALCHPGVRPGLRHATASGVASGVASALTQTVTVAATDGSASPFGLQVAGVAVLVAALATGGLLLSQTAYRDGLGAPLALVTLANPVAAAAIGLTLLGERFRGGAAGVVLAVGGAGLAAWGVIQLSRAEARRTAAAAPAGLPGLPTPRQVPETGHRTGAPDTPVSAPSQ